MATFTTNMSKKKYTVVFLQMNVQYHLPSDTIHSSIQVLNINAGKEIV